MIAGYLAERFNPLIYGGIALALGFAAGAGRSSGTALSADMAFALLMLAHFRIWDDLADRRADAAAHPDRVLVRAASVTPIVSLCVALGAASIVAALLRDPSGLTTGGLIGLQAILAIWYTGRRRRSAAGDAIVLAKYPAILLIVAGERVAIWPAPIAGAALLAYGAACAYEAWHDPSAFSLGGPS